MDGLGMILLIYGFGVELVLPSHRKSKSVRALKTFSPGTAGGESPPVFAPFLAPFLSFGLYNIARVVDT